MKLPALKEFDVIYYNSDGIESHRYTEGWEETNLYCVNCGLHGVFKSQSEDLDAGPTLMCRDCGWHHTINYFYEAKQFPGRMNDPYWQRLQGIRG